MYADGDVQLQNLDRKKFDQYNYISEDEDDDYEDDGNEQRESKTKQQTKIISAPPKGTKTWNDIPEGFLDPAPKGKKVSQAQNIDPKKPGDWENWGP